MFDAIVIVLVAAAVVLAVVLAYRAGFQKGYDAHALEIARLARREAALARWTPIAPPPNWSGVDLASTRDRLAADRRRQLYEFTPRDDRGASPEYARIAPSDPRD